MASISQLVIQSKLDGILADLGSGVGGDVTLDHAIATDATEAAKYLKTVSSLKHADKKLFGFLSSLTV